MSQSQGYDPLFEDLAHGSETQKEIDDNTYLLFPQLRKWDWYNENFQHHDPDRPCRTVEQSRHQEY